MTAQQRLERDHLQATHQARLEFARQRQTLPNHGVYQDFRTVIHVHAEDSNHTKGTRPEVLAAAKKAGVSIVMFTDHGGPKPETWHGLRDGVLFIAGEENGGAGLLRFPAVSGQNEDGELRFVSHIEERYDAPQVSRSPRAGETWTGLLKCEDPRFAVPDCLGVGRARAPSRAAD